MALLIINAPSFVLAIEIINRPFRITQKHCNWTIIDRIALIEAEDIETGQY